MVAAVSTSPEYIKAQIAEKQYAEAVRRAERKCGSGNETVLPGHGM